MPEEEAFGILVQLLKKYDIREQFTPQMDLLLLRLYQFDGLLHDHLPHIHRHFNEQGIRSNMYASQWFLTLFAYKFPLEMVYRIYDTLFAEGVNCLFRIGLALLAKNQANILSLDFDHLVTYLKDDMLAVYNDNVLDLLHEARKMTIHKKRLEKLSKDFQIENTKADNEACIIAKLTLKRKELIRVHDENDALQQKTKELKQVIERIPGTIESSVQSDMHQLCEKNQTLTHQNARLQDQVADMESMLIEIKLKYAHSESEREVLKQRLTELKKWMNSTL
ncbi:GTPase-activating protein [Rhizopus stolonifer]|uniref:GTPase-activating protein n=1 Tax=Rhizopus stolonifer TaxID=4846 RepID=A0A367KIP0_RHIST|nr:GTPase-activating protein [Rhizopus stolonifer]